MSGGAAAGARLPPLPARETAGVVADVLAPLLARGLLARRPAVVGVLDRLDADRRAVRRLQRLRDRHGPGPLLARLPGRDVALVLSPEDVRRVLDGTPEPFAAATREKRAALEQFQPHGVLISHGAERAERRRLNEAALDSGRPVHGRAGELLGAIAAEAGELAAAAGRSGELTWGLFAVHWWRLVRRIVLGDAAREDHAVTDLLLRLRGAANWSYLWPRRRRARDELLRRLRAYANDASPASLAGLIAALPAPPGADPVGQVPQWLFAFDAAGMATFRALALLAAQPEQARRAREEISAAGLAAPRELPFLRACVLESVRLWPTTPAILRETTAETAWAAGTLAPGAALVVFVPFLHRDGERLPFADAFRPELWLDGGAGEWPLIPFSAGPAACPGRDVVLWAGSSLMAIVLGRLRLEPHPRERERLAAGARLPATLSPFALRLRARP